jgi:hypothetical protein
METLVLEKGLNERLTGSRGVKNGREDEFLLLAKVPNRLLGKEAEEGPRHRARIGALSCTLKPARLNQRPVVVMREWHEAAVSLHGSRPLSTALKTHHEVRPAAELTAISNANI